MLILLVASNFATAQNTQSVRFDWTPPEFREDKTTPLPIAEIASYEIGYKLKRETTYKKAVVPGGATRSQIITGMIVGDYDARIATIDTNGLISAYVPIEYKIVEPPKLKPGTPAGFTATVIK